MQIEVYELGRSAQGDWCSRQIRRTAQHSRERTLRTNRDLSCTTLGVVAHQRPVGREVHTQIVPLPQIDGLDGWGRTSVTSASTNATIVWRGCHRSSTGKLKIDDTHWQHWLRLPFLGCAAATVKAKQTSLRAKRRTLEVGFVHLACQRPGSPSKSGDLSSPRQQ